MIRYLLGLISVAILVAALIYFYPGLRIGGMDFDHALDVFLRWPHAVTDGELPAPQTSPAPTQPVPTPPETSPEPTQPVPTPPETSPAPTQPVPTPPETSPEPTQPVPTPPAATSPAPGREPGTSTTLPTPSPRNLSMMTVRVQEALMRQGYYKGGVDGVSGPQTRAAIIEYQKAQGLPQTGRMDIQTLTRLGISIP